MKVPLMKAAFLEESATKEALADFILTSDRFSMSTQCDLFEKEFSGFQNTEHAILFNSGGSANLAMLQALKNLNRLRDGSKVGFSSVTWSTNVMPIIQLGMIPIPIDCDPSTLNATSNTLLSRLSETSLDALFITNALGFAGDLDQIKEICDSRNIVLIEDNCESLGTELPAGKTGNFGEMASFSFFVAHHMSTIEGGMVCTRSDELADMLRIVRANGWDRNLSELRQKNLRSQHGIRDTYSKYTFYDLGYNLRPTEITGFLGLTQIKFLQQNIRTREKNYKTLEKTAINNEQLAKLDHSHISVLSNFAFPVVCKTPEDCAKYMSRFLDAGIEVRPLISGNMQKQPFYKKYTKDMYELPGSDILHDCSFYCGNCPDYTASELDIIASCLIPL